MQMEPISKITNEQKDLAWASWFMQYVEYFFSSHFHRKHVELYLDM
jgi:hypothetical protein